MEEKIVYKGTTTKGHTILIRYPTEKDAQTMCDYINALSIEQTFVRFQGEQISLEDEEKYLQEQLKKIAKKQTVQLLVFCNEQLIGIAGIDMKDRTEKHEGVLGISLQKEFRGEGIGKKLMELLLQEAEDNVPNLRLVTLGVFGHNDLAINMYKKFGFFEHGRLPEGVAHKGQFVDHVYMYKKIR